MSTTSGQMDATSKVCHVVAMPYPGRGHVNPMINLCKLLAAKKTDILITVVVTEEWLGFIGPDPKPDNIRFSTIPNVLPSELVRGANHPAFYDAVMTKMGAPFERLLDQIQPPVATIIADIELLWAVPAGGRRDIPVASLSTPSASFFHLLFRNRELNLLGMFVFCLGWIWLVKITLLRVDTRWMIKCLTDEKQLWCSTF